MEWSKKPVTITGMDTGTTIIPIKIININITKVPFRKALCTKFKLYWGLLA